MYDRSVPSKNVPLEESDIPPWQNTPSVWRLAVTTVDGYHQAEGGGRCRCCCFVLPWFINITIHTKYGLVVVDVVVVFVMANIMGSFRGDWHALFVWLASALGAVLVAFGRLRMVDRTRLSLLLVFCTAMLQWLNERLTSRIAQ